MVKAIILFSGGVDSTVLLAMALKAGREPFALSFDYGQKHVVELEAASKIAAYYEIPHHVIRIDPSSFGCSSLVSNLDAPKNRTLDEMASNGIPNTYVPARNTLFLAYALGQCEMKRAQEIYFGANQMDYVCYPDCRPCYMEAFQGVMRVATKQAVEGDFPKLVTPLLNWNKFQIIKHGLQLKAPLEMTFSCYSPQQKLPCGSCDACILRNDGFEKAKSFTT